MLPPTIYSFKKASSIYLLLLFLIHRNQSDNTLILIYLCNYITKQSNDIVEKPSVNNY